MNGRRAAVRTLSSIKSSSNFIVDACSMIDSGVVNTIFKDVDDDGEDAGLFIVLVGEACFGRVLNKDFLHWFWLEFRLVEVIVFV